MMQKRVPLIQASNIRKSFSYPDTTEILKGVSLELYSGESIAITGPSGEGKSTLLHILGTLERPSSGSLKLLGQEVSQCDASLMRNKHIGFIFQSFNLLEDYTVLQNVLMPSLIAKKQISKGSEMEGRAKKLLESVGLAHRIHYSSKLLSGGEKQRVALARALCNDPGILLADEPSGNLDHDNSLKMHALLLSAVKGMRKGLIVVTHDPELAELCDRKFILREGLLSEQ